MRPGNTLAVIVTVLCLSWTVAAQQAVRVREAGRLGIGVGAGLPVPPFGATVGNRWDWQYSFIEFDWLGIHAPLSASSSTTDPKHKIDGAPWEVRSSVTFGVAF